MKKKKPKASNTENTVTREDPPYMKAFGGVWTNDKVGEVFITTTRQPKPKK